MPLFTIGHSNAATPDFIALLAQHQIEIIIDVRSSPYSRYNPQFNRETLKQALIDEGVSYLYLGDQLGGMPADKNLYLPTGRANYALIEQTDFYQQGIESLLQAASDKRVAVMCAEADYMHCHRFHLITRTLVNRGFEVHHILHTGSLITAQKSDFQPPQQTLF